MSEYSLGFIDEAILRDLSCTVYDCLDPRPRDYILVFHYLKAETWNE